MTDLDLFIIFFDLFLILLAKFSHLRAPAHPGDAQTAGLVSTRPFLPSSRDVTRTMPVKNSGIWRIHAKVVNSQF